MGSLSCSRRDSRFLQLDHGTGQCSSRPGVPICASWALPRSHGNLSAQVHLLCSIKLRQTKICWGLRFTLHTHVGGWVVLGGTQAGKPFISPSVECDNWLCRKVESLMSKMAERQCHGPRHLCPPALPPGSCEPPALYNKVK